MLYLPFLHSASEVPCVSGTYGASQFTLTTSQPLESPVRRKLPQLGAAAPDPHTRQR